jgi:hypothetical protein
VRVPAPVEEDHVTGLWAYHRARFVDLVHARGVTVVADDQFAACARAVIGEEQQCGERIGVDVTFESHVRPALDVQDHTIATILSGPGHLTSSHALSQVEKSRSIQFRQPWEIILNLIGMHPASWDMVHVGRFP